MIELVCLFLAMSGLGTRARQRGLSGAPVGVALAGWVMLMVMGLANPAPWTLFFRWGWIGAVYLYVETSHSGAKIEDSWQCPDCRLFNDERTLVCLCGYRHPDGPEDEPADVTEGPAQR